MAPHPRHAAGRGVSCAQGRPCFMLWFPSFRSVDPDADLAFSPAARRAYLRACWEEFCCPLRRHPVGVFHGHGEKSLHSLALALSLKACSQSSFRLALTPVGLFSSTADRAFLPFCLPSRHPSLSLFCFPPLPPGKGRPLVHGGGPADVDGHRQDRQRKVRRAPVLKLGR